MRFIEKTNEDILKILNDEWDNRISDAYAEGGFTHEDVIKHYFQSGFMAGCKYKELEATK
jgi:hypothetical protein